MSVLTERLQFIRNLSENWHEEAKGKVRDDVVDCAEKVLLECVKRFNVPCPYVYPTLDQGIIAEWSLRDWEVSAEFGECIKLHAVNVIDGNEMSCNVACKTSNELLKSSPASFKIL